MIELGRAHALAWNENWFAFRGGRLHRLPRSHRKLLNGSQIPESRVRVGDSATHLKDCSCGKLPDISLRASAISCSEIEMSRSLHSPYMLLRGRICSLPRSSQSQAPQAACHLAAHVIWKAPRLRSTPPCSYLFRSKRLSTVPL